MEPELVTTLGALGLVSVFAVREFFAYLKTKKSNGDSYSKEIFEELNAMNNNHLHSIEKAITDGNANLIESIHNDNTRMIELLGEIKGTLSK